MVMLKRLLVPIIASFMLVACGGGGGGGGSSESSPTNPYDADAKYTGTRTQATITKANKLDFLRALYGVEYEGFSLASSEQSAALQEQSFSSLTKDLTALALYVVKPSGYTLAAATPVNKTIACPQGGTTQITGEIDSQTGLGVATLNMVNCIATIGKANGTIQLAITGYNVAAQQPTAFTLTFQNLKVDYSIVSYTAVGTQSYSLVQGIETTTSNIHRLNHATNKQSLIKNYKVVSASPYDTRFKLSGQAYVQDQGYVNLTTLENVVFNSVGIPITGKALFSGAGNSKLRITASATSFMFELDSNGDGTYEETGYITFIDLFGSGDYCVSGC